MDRKEIDKTNLEKYKIEQTSPYIMPHEFLFLYANCSSRYNTLIDNHNPDMSSKKGTIYQWEIAEGKSI
jgi:hypothetical protein